MNAGFLDTLNVNAIDNRTWKLTKSLSYVTKEGETITAPVGFVTDLGSVPRLLWWFLSPWDIARAAVIHDFMYSRSETYKRKTADSTFLESMKFSKPKLSSIQINLAFLAVRIFGSKYYK
jgi:hypothetical protein